MEKLIKEYKFCLKDKKFLLASFVSVLFLAISLFVNFYAGVYATESASNPVTDIILNNIPIYHLDDVFIIGSWIFVIFIFVLCFTEPKRLPFTVKTIALFVLIRAIFITLTHLGPFPNTILANPSGLISYFVFGGDLFFSGHTGLPFLLSLVFWEQIWLRFTFIALSIIFAIVVLLAHLHYSIDVLAAFFITYTIFKIALIFFKKDRAEFFKYDRINLNAKTSPKN